ncbi:MAG TPA: transcriptional regulator [Methanomicrobiales archaeon]|nr:transcriptional regulator [Methanomicrobiales archaeon]
MTQEVLLQRVRSLLVEAGFQVSDRCSQRPRSFDLIAGDREVLMVVKAISHIDGVSEDIARDLDLVSYYLGGAPLIVGERTRDADLQRGAVYVRYGIYALSLPTLSDFLMEGIPPLIYVSPGGLYVNIDEKLLRALREERELSLGDLAHLLGVSRRTISKYENGMGTTMEIAVRIEEVFDTAITKPVDLLSHESRFARADEPARGQVLPDLERLGMEIHLLRRAPFEALARYDDETILTGYGTAQHVEKRAPLIGSISRIARARALCVLFGYRRQKTIGDTLVIGEERLHALEDGSELMELIREPPA